MKPAANFHFRPAHLLICSVLLFSIWGCHRALDNTALAEEKEFRPGKLELQELDLPVRNVSGHGGIRGLHMAGDSIVWLAGAQGRVVLIQGMECTDASPDSISEFRDVHGFDTGEALVLRVTQPAAVLRTTDGGTTWQQTYTATDSTWFLDGFSFRGDTGWAYGDPNSGYHYILQTTDRGQSWQRIDSASLPVPLADEAGFAASGASVAIPGVNSIRIGTGGESPRILCSDDGGQSWFVQSTPIYSGAPMRGIYALAYSSPDRGVAVGGEWGQDSVPFSMAFTGDGGRNWEVPKSSAAYRSSVSWAGGNTWLASGPTGIDRSNDGGQSWEHVDPAHFYVLQFIPASGTGFGAGPEGYAAWLHLQSR